jgi:AraC-like DNA-binding protein
LKEDKKMRKYNLQAIAIECGFNSAESFSTAFFKKTGIKPSFFIKELDKNSN